MCFDGANRVAYVNLAFERMTGLAAAELLGGARAAFEVRLAALLDQAIPEAADSGPDATERLFLRTPEKRVVKLSVRSGGGAGGLTVQCYQDVTHAHEVERMKSEFLATAAHELRTPMSSVLGFSRLLLDRKYDEATRRDLLETIHEQAQRLSEMINELLDLARIEARVGKDFDMAAQPLAPVIEQTVAALLVRDDPRQVRLRLPLEAVEVSVDAAKLRQALTNLLANAYKYSPRGGAIELETILESVPRPRVGIRVTDRGIGMTPEQAERCFERFYRADTSGSVSGTGLGLSLVKEILEIHGGTAEVCSRFGEGTAMTLWLPVLAAKAASCAPPAAGDVTS